MLTAKFDGLASLKKRLASTVAEMREKVRQEAQTKANETGKPVVLSWDDGAADERFEPQRKGDL